MDDQSKWNRGDEIRIFLHEMDKSQIDGAFRDGTGNWHLWQVKDIDIATPYFQSTGTLTPVGSLEEKLRRATRKLEQENDTSNEKQRKLQQYIKQVIHQAKPKEPTKNSFAKLLDSISNILPASTRTKVYEPAFNDLLANFLLEKQQCKTEMEFKWLTFWFYLRNVLLIPGSFKAMIVDKFQKLFPWISRK